MIRISKIIWAVFWLGAALILASVLAYHAINWYIDHHPRTNALDGSYVRYSNDLLTVGKPELYTITNYGVRLQLTASDASLQWGNQTKIVTIDDRTELQPAAGYKIVQDSQ